MVRFEFLNNLVTQNQVIGQRCALISLTGGLANISNNQLVYNGYLSGEQVRASPNDKRREFTYNYFPYKTYSFIRAQEHGIFYFNFVHNDVPVNFGHFVTNNTFAFNFCTEGCAYAFAGTKI